MAFTAQEEALVRELLASKSSIDNLTDQENAILSKLATPVKSLSSIPTVTTLDGTEKVFLRQGVTDKSATIEQIAAQVLAEGVTDAELAASSGAGLVGFQQAGTGSVLRTVDAKLKSLVVNVADFGAIGDGVTDDTSAIQAAITAVSASGGGVVQINRVHKCTSTVFVPSTVTLKGRGKGYEKSSPSYLLFVGSGTKSYSIPAATSINIANPDTGAAYLADSGTRGDSYKTLDLSVNFSAAVVLGKGARLEDLGVYPNFNGLTGYSGTDGNLSDDWDVGVWVRNASGWGMNNVTVDGHWRKSGVLVTASDIGDGVVPACELGQALHCFFGGFRGLTVRAPTTATGSNNYGFAGTDFINCYVRSLNHQSLHLATSSNLTTPFTSPSAALEMSGPTLRGVQFLNSTFMGRDDICMIFDQVSEILFSGCYEESKEIKVSGSFLTPSVGSRIVATANSVGVRFVDNSKYAVDFSPYYTKDTSLTTSRYNPSNSGVFNPNTARDDDYERPLFSASYGTRLRSGATWRIYNSAFSTVASVAESTGNLTANGTGTFGGNLTVSLDAMGLYANANPVIRRYGSGNLQIGNGLNVLADGTVTNPGIVRPTTDNTYSSGSASFRWSVVYAGTGTINTSDATQKQDVAPITDDVLDAWSEVDWCQYRFIDAVEAKGDQARIHTGLIAQKVEEAFANHSLNALDYGVLCVDQLEDGSTRYGVRYDEAFALESALMRRFMKKKKR